MADAPPTPAPFTVDVVIHMDPMHFRHECELDALSKQFAGWFVTNVTKMTEPKGADLFVAVVVSRDGQRAGTSYRDGRFVDGVGPTRPDPPNTPPQGYVWTVVPEGDDWRIEAGRQCRMFEGGVGERVRCQNTSVAALNRRIRRYGKGTADCWWAYCADHLYGRWIEDGRVMHWALAEGPRVAHEEAGVPSGGDPDHG